MIQGLALLCSLQVIARASESTSLHDPQPDRHYGIQSGHGLPPQSGSNARDTACRSAHFGPLLSQVQIPGVSYFWIATHLPSVSASLLCFYAGKFERLSGGPSYTDDIWLRPIPHFIWADAIDDDDDFAGQSCSLHLLPPLCIPIGIFSWLYMYTLRPAVPV